MKETIYLILAIALVLCGAVENADFEFDKPVKLLSPMNLPGYTSGTPSISADGLSLFFTSDMPPTSFRQDYRPFSSVHLAFGKSEEK